MDEIVRASGGDMRKSITYLQSAARLRGDEMVTENDIKEIAGVSQAVGRQGVSVCIVSLLQWIPEHYLDNLLDTCHKDSHERLESFVKVHVYS